MPTYEGLRLKVLKFWRLGLANYRKKQLKSTDFTIISNNCWGGMIYESYNLPKESPTVGMFFIAKDYIEFLSDLKGYINGKLTLSSPKNLGGKICRRSQEIRDLAPILLVFCLMVKIRLKSSSYITIVSRKQEKSGSVEYRELTGINYW